MGQTLSETVRANLRKLILHRFPGIGIQARATALGVGKGTVERIQQEEPHPFDLSVIEQIAAKCRVDPWKLFVEDFDPVAPPLLSDESVQERARLEAVRVFLGEIPEEKNLSGYVRKAQDAGSTRPHKLVVPIKNASDGRLSVSKQKERGRAEKPARTAGTSRKKRD